MTRTFLFFTSLVIIIIIIKGLKPENFFEKIYLIVHAQNNYCHFQLEIVLFAHIFHTSHICNKQKMKKKFRAIYTLTKKKGFKFGFAAQENFTFTVIITFITVTMYLVSHHAMAVHQPHFPTSFSSQGIQAKIGGWVANLGEDSNNTEINMVNAKETDQGH